MIAYVAGGEGAQQCIGECMKDDVGVAMAGQAAPVRDPKAS